LEFANSVFESSIKSNQSLSPGTVRNYRKALNHLIAFLKYRGTEKLLVNTFRQLLAEAGIEDLGVTNG
jgi:hypothetical protein